MIRMTDGKFTIEITMAVWQENGFSPCWVNDFFDVGRLPMDDTGAYIVPDLYYCLDMAKEWEQEDENNMVVVEPAAY